MRRILLTIFRLCLLTVLLVFVPLRGVYWRIRLLAIPPRPRNPSSNDFDVICFSHVAWSHIWQRNHHTMDRLANDRKVVYFQTANIAYLHRFVLEWPRSLGEYRHHNPKVKLVYPLLFPGQGRVPGIAWLNSWLLTTHLRWLEYTCDLRNPVLWFYYPAVASVLDHYDPAAVVYDIQDEYTAFDWSPHDIAEREKYLLSRANVIFAGTQTLYQRKASRTSAPSYFFPCAVEFEHFNAAAPHTGNPRLSEPIEFQGLVHPRLAYAGLIDKRIDADLLVALARAHPEWEIVMTGPIDSVLFDPEKVTAGVKNIHFIGQVQYTDLPAYLAHCDLYIMPWQLNDLTHHINPTKTLEFLAAGRPVVSINLPDLQNLFSECVTLATTSDEFISACENVLAGHHYDKVIRGLERARSLDWQTVVSDMFSHVQTAMHNRSGDAPIDSSGFVRPSGETAYHAWQGSHWNETHQHRVLDQLHGNFRFWFILGHLLMLPFAALVLLLTALSLPLYWIWDKQSKLRRSWAKIDPAARIILDQNFEKPLLGLPSSSHEVTVSIIIPIYNRVAWVDQVIRSVLFQQIPPGINYEIIAVDNGSTDGTYEKLQTYPVRVIRCEERGPGAARNAGVAAARGSIVVFTDSDCVADPNWLLNLVQPFKDPEVILTGGRIASMTHDDYVATYIDREQVLNNRRFFTGSAWFPRFFATANAACRRECLLAINGFDNSLWMSEDADMCWRLLDLNGKMVYVDDAIVYHQHRQTLTGLFRQSMDYGAAAADVFAKHHRKLQTRHAINWTTIKYTARTPLALLRDIATKPNTFDKTWELYSALWRLGFFIGCVKSAIRNRVLFY